jgi:hypothetical protein
VKASESPEHGDGEGNEDDSMDEEERLVLQATIAASLSEHKAALPKADPAAPSTPPAKVCATPGCASPTCRVI